MPRLTNKGITLREMIILSQKAYVSGIDKKSSNARQKDVISIKIIGRSNLSYNKSTKEWEQSGRDVKFIFTVRSNPTSYKKIDTIHNHYYPITILIHDIDKEFNSTFKLRDGSLKKPLFTPAKSTAKKRIQIANQNIKNGVQLQFFFDSEYVYAKNNILYGVNHANGAPKNRNKKEKIFLSKHSYFLFTSVLPYIFQKKNLYLGRLFKNAKPVKKK